MSTRTTTTEREFDEEGRLIREITTVVQERQQPIQTLPGGGEQWAPNPPYTITCHANAGDIRNTVKAFFARPRTAGLALA